MSQTAGPFRIPADAQAGFAAPRAVTAAVREAAARTGVDFTYLMAKAAQESEFRPDAKAATSSAAGLYQFIERTWLDMVDRHGADHGLAAEAEAITRDGRGRPHVADPDEKRRILALRDDPRLSALMAAEYAAENSVHLQEALGSGTVGPTELYLAHFLGPAGAARFLEARAADPGRPAAEILPEAAAANRAVFYGRDGRALTLDEVHAAFARKFDGGTGVAVAGAGVADGPPDEAPRPAVRTDDPAWLRAVPRPASAQSLFTVMVLSTLDSALDPSTTGRSDEDRDALGLSGTIPWSGFSS